MTDYSTEDEHLSAAPPGYDGATVNILSLGGGSSVAGSSGAAGRGPPAPAPAPAPAPEESAEEMAAALLRMEVALRKQTKGKLARRAPLRVKRSGVGDDDRPRWATPTCRWGRRT